MGQSVLEDISEETFGNHLELRSIRISVDLRHANRSLRWARNDSLSHIIARYVLQAIFVTQIIDIDIFEQQVQKSCLLLLSGVLTIGPDLKHTLIFIAERLHSVHDQNPSFLFDFGSVSKQDLDRL